MDIRKFVPPMMKHRRDVYHSGESRNSGSKLFVKKRFQTWMPAFAGMTMLFVLVVPAFAKPHAFPVPFVAKQHDCITFNELPGSGEIKIFNIVGEEVVRLPVAVNELQKQWHVTNSAGEKVATGVYLFIIDAGGQKTTGKVVVIR